MADYKKLYALIREYLGSNHYSFEIKDLNAELFCQYENGNETKIYQRVNAVFGEKERVFLDHFFQECGLYFINQNIPDYKTAEICFRVSNKYRSDVYVTNEIAFCLRKQGIHKEEAKKLLLDHVSQQTQFGLINYALLDDSEEKWELLDQIMKEDGFYFDTFLRWNHLAEINDPEGFLILLLLDKYSELKLEKGEAIQYWNIVEQNYHDIPKWFKNTEITK